MLNDPVINTDFFDLKSFTASFEFLRLTNIDLRFINSQNCFAVKKNPQNKTTDKSLHYIMKTEHLRRQVQIGPDRNIITAVC